MVDDDRRLALVDKALPAPIAVPQGEPTEAASTDPYVGASLLPILPAESARLAEDIPIEDLDILPTGEVYASQVRYRRILNETFGPGQWAMRPMSEPKIQDRTVMRFFALYVRGCFVSEAPGECDYQPNNPRMSYATALEAAKSNALTRCCKDLGIASECWDRHFCEEFKAKYCVRGNDGKWRRKDRQAMDEPPQRAPEPRPEGVISEAQQKRLFAIAKAAGHAPADVKTWLTATHGCASTVDITMTQYNAICDRLAEKRPLNEPEPPPEVADAEQLPEWDHSEAGAKG